MKLMIEWTFEGGLKSVGEYGTSGTEPVINQECMLVHEKEDSTCQFEWYRDNNTYYYRLKQELEAVFFVLARIVSIPGKIFAGCPRLRGEASKCSRSHCEM